MQVLNRTVLDHYLGSLSLVTFPSFSFPPLNELESFRIEHFKKRTHTHTSRKWFMNGVRTAAAPAAQYRIPRTPLAKCCWVCVVLIVRINSSSSSSTQYSTKKHTQFSTRTAEEWKESCVLAKFASALLIKSFAAAHFPWSLVFSRPSVLFSLLDQMTSVGCFIRRPHDDDIFRHLSPPLATSPLIR